MSILLWYKHFAWTTVQNLFENSFHKFLKLTYFENNITGAMADPGFLTRGLEVVYQAIICSGGSRISLRRGRQLPRGRQHTILPNFAKFSQKLHEIERILAPGEEGHASLVPPLDPPLIWPIFLENYANEKIAPLPKIHQYGGHTLGT